MSLFSKKASLYETSDPDATTNLERITKKFSVDLRNQVRKVQKVELMGKDWFILTDTLEHISKIANIEAKPKPHEISSLSSYSSIHSLASPSSGSGSSHKQSHNQTLWEKEQFCVRYMVEEGKVNVLLRLLREWKQTKFSPQKVAEQLKVDPDVVRAKMRSFERSVGILLKCCFSSIEALQTLDTTELVVHASIIFNNALKEVDLESFPAEIPQRQQEDSAQQPSKEDSDTPSSIAPTGDTYTTGTSTTPLSPNTTTQFQMPPSETDFETSQEFLVFEYLRLLLDHIEDLQEEMVGKAMLSHDTVNLSVRFLDLFHTKMSQQCQVVCSSMLARLMDTEYFQTNREKFLPTDLDKVRLVSLKKKFVKGLLVNYQRKRMLRPLMDNIMRFEITHPSEVATGGDDDEFADNDDDTFKSSMNAESSVILGASNKSHVFSSQSSSSGGNGGNSPSVIDGSSNPLSFLQNRNRTRKNIYSMISGGD
uniref:Uncharacterized protein n=1 Tax=Percolomonas cosmopolitus TaxID=63605 RepID=A0A7S1KR03_9EUKA|mmetsp:Transcript_5889/g.22337  ORF Transcript_5889/g.22337 Transcript_5889/m.22337 type:complete len:480 (+) Transcript_5889:343-1782(+)